MPNIIWVLGGDAKAQTRGYDRGRLVEFDRRAVFRAMAEGIAHGVTGRKPAWNRPDPAWSQLVMTYHPDGDYLDNSSTWFHEDAWLTANGVEVWSDVDQVYPTMLRDYLLEKPVKPSLFLEGSYEYGSYRHECGWVTPLKYRRQVYLTFFAGGAGHTYGAGPIWAMRGSGGNYNCGFTWKQALDFPGAAQFAGIAKGFLLAHEWSQWIPDGRMIDSGPNQGDNLKAAVLHASGQEASVYFSNNSVARIRSILIKAAKAHWFDPRSGDTETAGPFEPNEIRVMVPPDRWRTQFWSCELATECVQD